MKLLITALVISFTQTALAQSYDEQMNKAGEALQKKTFAAPLLFFKQLLKILLKLALMILLMLPLLLLIVMPNSKH
jgi:hypothetical protein